MISSDLWKVGEGVSRLMYLRRGKGYAGTVLCRCISPCTNSQSVEQHQLPVSSFGCLMQGRADSKGFLAHSVPTHHKLGVQTTKASI